MTMIKAVEPGEWGDFLRDFSKRNQGRRARFEVFGREGIAEEDEEALFTSVSIDGHTVAVKRHHEARGEDAALSDELTDIRGISVQYDTDNSEDMLEFTDSTGEMVTLHFESRVDGDS